MLPLRLLSALLIAISVLRADESLAHARSAQTLLGPEIWSRVIRIENQARFSRYPRTLHALIFELAGRLWFYADTDGTQSFSLHQDRLVEEKADFGPLLRDIEPGFARWTAVPADLFTTNAREGAPPNACFIESVAVLRTLLAQGESMVRPRLLSFYADTAGGRIGHTVLTYESHGRLTVIDPGRRNGAMTFPSTIAANPVGLAQALMGSRVFTARLLPLEVSNFFAVSSEPSAGRTAAAPKRVRQSTSATSPGALPLLS